MEVCRYEIDYGTFPSPRFFPSKVSCVIGVECGDDPVCLQKKENKTSLYSLSHCTWHVLTRVIALYDYCRGHWFSLFHLSFATIDKDTRQGAFLNLLKRPR